MHIRAYADSNHDRLSYNDVYPALNCTPHGTECDHGSTAPPPPGLANKVASPNATRAAQEAAHGSGNTTLATSPVLAQNATHASTPSPNPAAADINRIGQRNFIGFLVLGVLILVGFILWMTFGKWPKHKMAQLRERLAARSSGRGYRTPAAGMDQVQVVELGRDPRSQSTVGSSHLGSGPEKFRREVSADSMQSEGALEEGYKTGMEK